jgi:NADH-quinone oxidoreductase subunit F
MERVLPREPIPDLAGYLAAGGGAGIERARSMGPDAVVDEVRRSGLRGRGGAGFPTGIKWRGAAADQGPRAIVCNAAEGEPGTVKDRALITDAPYRVVEGIAIAALAVGAATAYLGIKRRFTGPIAAVERAASEMGEAGFLDGLDLRIVEGPDDYLFGVESAMLEVIEGRDPLPRLVPPYVQGITGADGRHVTAVVNNVETLANVPGIVANGADWFRAEGTAQSPGTMVFTVSGDVRNAAIAELALGTPLSFLIYGPGGGLEAGRRPKLVVSGVSNRPLAPHELDTPLSFEAMAAIGSGLGSGGYIVYDDTTCAVEVGAALSGFLQVGSCGQCPPCKLGTTAFTERFSALMRREADLDDLDEMAAWLSRVTDGNRCGLGAGQQSLAKGILSTFADDVVACLEGRCPGHRGLLAPSPIDHDPSRGRSVARFPG